IHDRDDAALGLREREVLEPSDHAGDHALIGEVGAAVLGHGDGAAAVDDELHRDATLEVRVGAEAVLVAETEAAEVLANDALDDLGREAPVDLRGPLTDGGGAGLVRAAEAAVAVAETLTG